eukprot:9321503-Pyramimonas_sp.AAC.1
MRRATALPLATVREPLQLDKREERGRRGARAREASPAGQGLRAARAAASPMPSKNTRRAQLRAMPPQGRVGQHLAN